MSDRILIMANTPWEADALVAVFNNGQARPQQFPQPITPPQVAIPFSDGTNATTVNARLAYPNVEVWCIGDLLVDPNKNKASSEEKARVLPFVANNGIPPSLVIAFGTAAFPDPQSYDGVVVIGSNVFVYNPYAASPNPASQWTHPDIGKLLDSSKQPINQKIFPKLRQDLRPFIEGRFLSTPIDPAKPPILIASGGYVAVSDVNVTSVDDYAWADPEALKAFAAAAPKQSVGSVETTHGVTHCVIPSSQFLFVSGIANRLGYFNMEAAPRSYAQDFVVAHNAAIALAWLLPLLLP